MTMHVTALDIRFADADGIDRFERFVYQGKASAADWPLIDHNSVLACMQALAAQLGMALAELPVLLICQPADAALHEHIKPLCNWQGMAADLPAAMEQARSHELLALVAVSPGQGQPQQQASLSIADDFAGYQPAAGVAGIVLASADAMAARSLSHYACICGFASGDDVAIACHQAMDESLLPANQIRYIEVSALADAGKSRAEAEGLVRAYRSEKQLHSAIGGLRAVTGEGGVFSQLAGLVKTVLVLHQRYYPGLNDWQKPADSIWQQSPFYMPCESRPWFPAADGKAMAAAYSCMCADAYAHFVLQENAGDRERVNGYLASADLVLMIVSAAGKKALLAKLDTLEKLSLAGKPLRRLAADYHSQFVRTPQAYTLCLLAESRDELLREITLARDGINQAFAGSGEWKTPKGSYFTTEPVGDQGVTFLYPGIGATYVGLGRDIFHLFPQIYLPVAALAEDIGASLKDDILNPRSIERLGFHQVKALDHSLRNTLADIAECGVGFACVFTRIFEQVFDLKADFATGYSMGEVSMYAALGCWKNPGVMSRRLAESDTFNHRLTGELQTLRQHWDLPPANEGEIEQLWETYTLKATPEQVAEAAMDEDRVYTTIINTPDSLVIGGYPDACQRVIKKLGVRAMPLDMPNAIHSAPAFKEYQQMEALYTMEVNERIATRLYSSSCYLPVPQRSKAIANSIAKCLCDPVDFPRLINTMYDKGARVFIEMGPGRSLCSWVEKILRHDEAHPHVSVPVNAKGTSDELTILRAVAKLVSHGVRLDLHVLYHGSLLAGPASAANHD